GRLREKSCAAKQHGHAKAGDAGKQNETTRREDARFLSWNAHSHNGHSIFGAAGPGGTPCTAKRATPPYPALSKKLTFVKLGKLQKFMKSHLLVLRRHRPHCSCSRKISESRAVSAGVSFWRAPAARSESARPRRASTKMPHAPMSSTAAGPSHSSAVCHENRGLSSTNSP